MPPKKSAKSLCSRSIFEHFANLYKLQHCSKYTTGPKFSNIEDYLVITYLLLVPRTLICTWTLFWDSPIYFGSAERKRKYVDNPDNRSEPVFVNFFRSPGIDSEPGRPVLQIGYRLHRLAESNWFLGSLNVSYKYGLS